MAFFNKDTGEVEVSEAELADYLGVSDRRVRQMVKENLVFKTGKGRYDLKRSVKAYIENMKQKEAAKSQDIEKLKIAKEAEGLMHEKLKKRKTELVVMQMEKKLHAQEDVEEIWNASILAAKSRLLSVPVKVAPQVMGLENQVEIQGIIRREMADALNEISEYDVSKFDKDFEDEQYGTVADEDD